MRFPLFAHKIPAGDDPNSDVARLRRGDQSAFNSLFDKYYRDIAIFTYRFVGDYQQAEDIAVDLFTKVWDRREQWEGESDVRMFLYRAARNAALNVRRDETRHLRLLSEAGEDEVPGMSQGGDDSLDDIARLEHLNSAIQQLPEMRRAVFTLRWEQDMPYAEISDLLGISVKTAKMHMGLAVRDLKAIVRR